MPITSTLLLYQCYLKDATVQLKEHESSKRHLESVLKIFPLPSTTQDIGVFIKTTRAGKLENHHWFKMFYQILGFGPPGSSLQGVMGMKLTINYRERMTQRWVTGSRKKQTNTLQLKCTMTFQN